MPRMALPIRPSTRLCPNLPSVTRANGVAVGAIRRSHHCGAAGHPVERLAEAGLVAMMFANTPSAIAPWGGSKAVFGTNPVAFACPYPGHAPIVVDLSLSKVARGNIMAAKQRGETIPEGWALDEDGKPTTDPDAALRGTMLPLGDAKGTALALMVELLAAGLTGSNFAAEASSFLDAKGSPPGTGQLIVAFDAAGHRRPGRAGAFRGSGLIDRRPAGRAASRQPAARGAGQGAGAGAHHSRRAAGRDRGGLMPAKPRSRPADIRIRKGRLADIDALMALEHGVFTVDHLSRREFPELSDLAPFGPDGGGGGRRTIAGYVHVLFRPQSKAARLYSIGVVARAAGRGIGIALLQAGEQAARKRQAPVIRLEVQPGNRAAIARYEKSGYRRTGRPARLLQRRQRRAPLREGPAKAPARRVRSFCE